MAESSSSEESSDEYEHRSPSLSGPVSPKISPTAAASHPNRKKLRYFRDYLQRLPKHQRRRIQKEIKKGRKPGEVNLYNIVYYNLCVLIRPQLLTQNRDAIASQEITTYVDYKSMDYRALIVANVLRLYDNIHELHFSSFPGHLWVYM